VQFEIMTEARESLKAWLERRRGNIYDFAFPSRVDYLGHLSTRQYARLVDEWVSTVGLDKREYGTHSLRRTKASLIYKATGNLRAVQILLGHTNIGTRSDISASTSTTPRPCPNGPKFEFLPAPQYRRGAGEVA
jgi:integrase